MNEEFSPQQATSPDHTAHSVQPLGRLLSILATGFGLAWIVWLIGTGHAGAQPVLFGLAIAASVLSVVRTALWAWRIAPRHVTSAEEVSVVQPSSGLVVVLANHHSHDAIRTSLLAAGQVVGASHIVLAADRDAADLSPIANRTEAVCLDVHELSTYLDTFAADYPDAPVLVVDADHVPFPDALSSATFANAAVGMVQAHVPDGWDTSDATTAIVREADHARGATIFAGTAAVFRAQALASIGGLRSETAGGPLGTTMALHANGWRTESADLEIVAAQTSPNLGSRLALARHRAAADLRASRGGLRVFSRNGATISQRLTALTSTLDVFAGLSTLAVAAVAATSLLTGRLPFTGKPMTIVALGASYLVLAGLARVVAVDSTRSLGQTMYDNMHLVGVRTDAIVRAIAGRRTDVMLGSVDEGGLGVVRHLRVLSGVIIVLDAALIARAAADLFSRFLPQVSTSVSLFTVASGLALLVPALGGMRLVMSTRQRRDSHRVPVELSGIVGSSLVRIIDLTPEGVGFETDSAVTVGEPTSVTLTIPTLTGGRELLQVAGIPTYVQRRSDGVTRVGLAAAGMTPVDHDLLLQYCRVVHPFLLARGASTLDVPEAVVRSIRATTAPRGPRSDQLTGVNKIARVLSISALLAVGVANLPPYGVATAGERHDGGSEQSTTTRCTTDDHESSTTTSEHNSTTTHEGDRIAVNRSGDSNNSENNNNENNNNNDSEHNSTTTRCQSTTTDEHQSTTSEHGSSTTDHESSTSNHEGSSTTNHESSTTDHESSTSAASTTRASTTTQATTTSVSSSSSVESSSTSAAPSSSTSAAPSSSSSAPSSSSSSVESSSTSAAPTTAAATVPASSTTTAATEVKDTSTQKVSNATKPGSLAVTGAAIGGLLTSGFSFLIAGFIIVGAISRRREALAQRQ